MTISINPPVGGFRVSTHFPTPEQPMNATLIQRIGWKLTLFNRSPSLYRIVYWISLNVETLLLSIIRFSGSITVELINDSKTSSGVFLILGLISIDNPSVPNGPGARQGPEGGLPRARDRTGRQKKCRPRPQSLKTAVLGKDDRPDNLRH